MEAPGGAGAGRKPLCFKQLQGKGFKVLFSGAAGEHHVCCNRAVIPMHFQRNHLEKRVNHRLLLTNVCVYLLAPNLFSKQSQQLNSITASLL